MSRRSSLIDRLWPIALETQKLVERFGLQPFHEQLLTWRSELPPRKEDRTDEEIEESRRKRTLLPIPLYPTLPEKFTLVAAAHDVCVQWSGDSQEVDAWPDIGDFDSSDRAQFARCLEGIPYMLLVQEMRDTEHHPYGASEEDAKRLLVFIAEIGAWLSKHKKETAASAVRPAPKLGKRRKRKSSSKASELTAKQVEALEFVSECEGNIADAARRAGIDRSSMKQRYEAGLKKLGIKALGKGKPKTTGLPRDRRGQEDLTADDDRRR